MWIHSFRGESFLLGWRLGGYIGKILLWLLLVFFNRPCRALFSTWRTGRNAGRKWDTPVCLRFSQCWEELIRGSNVWTVTGRNEDIWNVSRFGWQNTKTTFSVQLYLLGEMSKTRSKPPSHIENFARQSHDVTISRRSLRGLCGINPWSKMMTATINKCSQVHYS